MQSVAGQRCLRENDSVQRFINKHF